MSVPSRRQVLFGGAALAVGAAAAETTRAVIDAPSPAADPAPAEGSSSTAAAGRTQAGVDRPVPPLAHLHLHALTAPASVRTREAIGALLAGLGERVLALVASAQAGPAGEAAGDLTIQVGIGSELLALAELADAPDVLLPQFRGSAALADDRRGGDLFLQVAAERPELVNGTVDALLAALPGFTPRWSQVGYRPLGDGAVTRNPFGYEDGIVQPTTDKGVPEHVWLTDGPLAGATVGVVRRFVLDTAAFHRLPAAEQDGVFGRERVSSVPLSGGAPRADVNLGAKSPSGAYLVPVDSHARAAHPSFVDVTVMLRRGYGFRETVDGAADRSGLLFISYQDDITVFTRTQQRMDRTDRLMELATPTAEAGFLVLPGFDRDRPLGSSLFG
ncbi:MULTISPECIES: Dyp-type peroxidase [unclassified Nocardioides]|uniref:Dyp-type peroxidase n=1 Tax=unclassified Nocardioides TaxID=2615069 RepID=UPI000703C278|nr:MULTISPECIES: Dyp-type peroxidase [unclassified Nocardioides]